jgi:preprotein translocase subunit YajC
MKLIGILLMAPPSGGQGSGGGISQLIFFALIIVVFYFFMIRPQTKKAKAEREFKDALKKGDRVVTIGGIHGRINEVGEKTFTVEISDGVRVKLEKSAVSMDATRQLEKQPA